MSTQPSSSGDPSPTYHHQIDTILQDLQKPSDALSLSEKTRSCAHMIVKEIQNSSGKNIEQSLIHARALVSLSKIADTSEDLLKGSNDLALLIEIVHTYTTYLESHQLPEATTFSHIKQTLLNSIENDTSSQALLLQLVQSNSMWACKHFFNLVEKNNAWALSSLEDLSINYIEQSHILKGFLELTSQGHEATTYLFLPILSSRSEVLYHSITKEILSHPFFQNAHVLGHALKLAEDSPVMQNLLSDEIFSDPDPDPFLPLLSEQVKNDSRMAKLYLKTLGALSTSKPNSDLITDIFMNLFAIDVSSEIIDHLEREITDLAMWFQAVHNYQQEDEHRSVENLPYMVAHKLLFANAVREATLLDLIVHKKEKELPPPANHSCFASTACWHIGSVDHFKKNQVPAKALHRLNYLLSHMGSIGEKYGIEIVSNSIYEKSEHSNVRNIPHSTTNTWNKDNQVASLYGNVPTLGVSSIFSTGKTTLQQEEDKETSSPKALSFLIFDDILDESKRQRIEERKVETSLFLGQVGLNNEACKPWGFANIPCKFHLCYTEEGNHIIGDGFMIIGKDSLEVAKHTIACDIARLGYIRRDGKWEKREKPYVIGDRTLSGITDEEALLLFAHSYGIPLEEIYVIEQPAEYHLDVAMALIGDRKIMLNDSLAAAEQMLKIVKKDIPRKNLNYYQDDIDAFLEHAQEKKEIEDKVQAELESFGFEVVRFGGTTYHPIKSYDINLFNFLSATSPKPPHEKVIVAMGCSEEFQNRFRDFLQEHAPDVLPENIHFLDEEWGQYFLTLGGGIRCMTCDFPVSIP